MFSYKKNNPIIKNVSFDIFDNEYVCIIGHNGSGKSTISKLIVNINKPASGKIKIYDHVIDNFNMTFLRNTVGIIFQNPDNQFIGLTAEDDIAFGLENRLVDSTQIAKIVSSVAKIVKIEDILEKDASSLSGGQKQKVAIASTLAVNPKVIIFDESTSMLDPKAKIQIKELMLELKTKYKKTIISITHDMDEVINADRVLIMKGGEIIENSTPASIFEDANKLKNIKLDVPLILQASLHFNETNTPFEPRLNYDTFIKQVVERRINEKK
jgi:energy-coupling factor transport system ATP-binding protein